MSQCRLALSALALLWAMSCSPNFGPDSLTGERLYTRYGCAACHGPTGVGGPLGPPLVGASDHWDRPSLVLFLTETRTAIAADERLSALDRKYRTDMRPFREVATDQLARIADFVLSLDQTDRKKGR